MLVRLTYKSLQNRNYFKSKILYRVDLNKTGKKNKFNYIELC